MNVVNNINCLVGISKIISHTYKDIIPRNWNTQVHNDQLDSCEIKKKNKFGITIVILYLLYM